MKLSKDDVIVTAFAESKSGPGWANSPIIVIVESRLDRVLRKEWIQPDEQTDDMFIFYGVSEAAHKGMTDAVKRKYKKKT